MKFILVTILLFTFGISTFAQKRFPEEVNLSEVEINVKRGDSSFGCLNCRSGYEATIDGNGIVKFQRFIGKNQKETLYFAIPIQQVEKLLNEFKEINFLNLEDKYFEKKLPNGVIETVDHSVRIVTTLKISDKTKSVETFYGTPEKLIELEKEIHDIITNLIKAND